MTLIGLILVLVLVGVGLYLLNLVPMDATIKTIIRQALGLLNWGPRIG